MVTKGIFDKELKQAILVIKNYIDDSIDNIGFDEKIRKLNYFSNKANYVESEKKLNYHITSHINPINDQPRERLYQ